MRRFLSMRERSGRQVVPERSGPSGLARRASAANATNQMGRSGRVEEQGARLAREVRFAAVLLSSLVNKRSKQIRGPVAEGVIAAAGL